MTSAKSITDGIQILCKYLKPENQFFGTNGTRFLMPIYPNAPEVQPYKMWSDKPYNDLGMLEHLGWRYSYSGWQLELEGRD